MGENEIILYPNEIESYLESLQKFDVSEIGCVRWFQQQDRIYKLSLQASIDARARSEEIVKDEMLIHQKVPVLVHDLIATELWRLKILPLLLKSESTSSTLPLYIVLYQEITIVSFLETLLFHENIVETASDVLVDLVDYCYRKIIVFKSLNKDEIKEESGCGDEVKRFEEQQIKMGFEAGIKCISIVSCMTQHKRIIPLSVLHRLLEVHDIPLLFTNLLYEPPWVREVDGHIEKFQDSKWNKVSSGELFKLSKVEGQLWIALIQLLLDPSCQRKYDMTDFRKDQIMKLRSKLNEVVMDQIPILNELLRYLEQLNLFDAPTPKTGILIEQIPEIWEGMQAANKNRWKKIAARQAKEHFSLSEGDLQDFCKRLSVSFDLKHLEAMIPDQPACANCQGKGEKRCSRCKNEWYCGRSCQVEHWTKHKPACDLMVEDNKT